MGLNVANCPRCGRIMVKGLHAFCPNCIKEIDQQYERCIQYLREHKGTTIIELSEAVDVSVKQITKFIREGRISIVHAPNMAYACEVCGTNIREGTMCESCRSKLVKDLSNSQQDEKRKQEQQMQANKLSFNIQDRLRDRH
jgi:flagellar operon protein (TIGR03826 family)